MKPLLQERTRRNIDEDMRVHIKYPGAARLWEGGITEGKYQHYFQGSIFNSHNITNAICIKFAYWFS